MGQVIPGSLAAPLPMETEFISSNDKAVLFLNFAVDHTDLRQEHVDFIANILVPFYIQQIESLGFRDKFANIRPVGKASATGQQQHNLELSAGRATNVGQAVKKHFDLQKGRGALSQNIQINVLPIAQGDAEERRLLGGNPGSFPPKLLESKSNQFRAVILGMRVVHDVDPEDEKIFCREILNLKLKKQTVPTNLLEQKLDELQRKMPPELLAATKQFFDSVKGLIKVIAEELLKGAEFAAPELFLLFKTIDFITPSDIALLFEFKDSRGRLKQYRFDGSANKIDLNAIEVLCQVLSLLKWLSRLPKALDEAERELTEAEKKLKLRQDEIDRIAKAIAKAKKFVGGGKKIFDAITAKGSLFRRIVGDTVVDLIVQAVNDGVEFVIGVKQAMTDFAPVHFESLGVFDIFSFAGVARTQAEERFGSDTTVALDFAARANQSLLGFQGHVVMTRKFTLTLTLASHEQSNGVLSPSTT